MKNNSKNIKWMIFLMILLVAISITLTTIVVLHMVSKDVAKYPSDIIFSENNHKNFTLHNVYITDTDGNQITFLYEGDFFTLEGQLKEPYKGIADIKIADKKIKKMIQKKEGIQGELLCFTDKEVEIAQYGSLALDKNVTFYEQKLDGTVSILSKKDLYIGETDLYFAMAKSEICAIIRKESAKTSNLERKIRVLIKNSENIFFEKLYLTSDRMWTINDKEIPDNENREIKDNTIIACKDGKLYLTTDKGERISEGYEGLFYTRKTSKGLVLINEIDMETYIKYVLPSEMEDYFPFEAQKAQAVCARTFAYSQLKNQTYAMYGANVDDSTSFQVYNRFGTTSLTDRAVEETKDEIISCQSEPITCYYYSTSPGVTNTLDVWGENNAPYIRKTSTLTDDEVDYDLKNEKDLQSFLLDKPDSFDQASPFYRWRAYIDVTSYQNETYGKMKSFSVQSRNASGYVTGLCIVCEKETVTLSNENEIRNFLGQFLTTVELSDGTIRDHMQMLPSACFFVEKQDDNNYLLYGGGFGHGIGMSQFAAGKMAEEGWNYKEIILFFYENVEICKK